MDDSVRLDILAQFKRREIIVAAHYRTFDAFYSTSKFLNAVIEFVVAQCNNVVTESVNQTHFNVALKNSEIRCALIEIAGVKKQYILLAICLTDTIHESSSFN